MARRWGLVKGVYGAGDRVIKTFAVLVESGCEVTRQPSIGRKPSLSREGAHASRRVWGNPGFVMASHRPPKLNDASGKVEEFSDDQQQI